MPDGSLCHRSKPICQRNWDKSVSSRFAVKLIDAGMDSVVSGGLGKSAAAAIKVTKIVQGVGKAHRAMQGVGKQKGKLNCIGTRCYYTSGPGGSTPV